MLDVTANNTSEPNTTFEAHPPNLNTRNKVLRTSRISTKPLPYRACHHVCVFKDLRIDAARFDVAPIGVPVMVWDHEDVN